VGPRHQGRRQIRRLIAAASGWRACLAAGCVVAAALPGALLAADLFRWVDAQGRAHVSDQPPPNPPANMTREAMPDPHMNTQQGVTPQQRMQRQEQDRARVERQPGRPAATAPAGSDCQARWAAYQDSQACFESYRTAEAGLKPEAFDACGPEVFDPSPECGPPR